MVKSRSDVSLSETDEWTLNQEEMIGIIGVCVLVFLALKIIYQKKEVAPLHICVS